MRARKHWRIAAEALACGTAAVIGDPVNVHRNDARNEQGRQR